MSIKSYPVPVIARRGRRFEGNCEPLSTLANKAVCEESPVRVGETGRRLAIAERDLKAVGKTFHGPEPTTKVAVYHSQKVAENAEKAYRVPQIKEKK